MRQYIIRFLREENAVTMVEYSVMLAMIVLVAFLSIGALGLKSGWLWGGISDTILEKGGLGH